jgi:hypothetical protein
MPALVTGIVVLWQRDDTDEKNPTIILERAECVRVYSPEHHDDGAITRKIASTYIERQAISDEEKLKLWKRFGEGSLQVVEVTEASVTPPPISVTPRRPATGRTPQTRRVPENTG